MDTVFLNSPKGYKNLLTTMNDLVKEFNVRTGYCHSDEITLIFDRVQYKDLNNNGRVMKLCSFIVGYCSVKFNLHFSNLVNGDNEKYEKNVQEKINRMNAHFDARPIVNHMIWRSCNCISTSVFLLTGDTF